MASSSQLIVAFSNAAPGARTLGVFDFESESMEWIDTSWLGADVTGFDDVYRDGDHLWLLPQTGDRLTSRLVDVGPSFTRREIIALGCGDAHALVRIGDMLLVTDTTRNRVCELRHERGVWIEREHTRVAEENEDAIHLNSIGQLHDAAYVSCFGTKPAGGWKLASDGRIIELHGGGIIAGGLGHPHSLTSDGTQLYWTESSSGRIHAWKPADPPRCLIELGGYLRGLAVTRDAIYVGSSAQRGQSRSTGVRNVRSSDRADDYESWIYRISIGDQRVTRRRVSSLGAEIFELVALDAG